MLKKIMVISTFVLLVGSSFSWSEEKAAPSGSASDQAMDQKYGKDFVSFFDKKNQANIIAIDDPKGEDFQFNDLSGKKSGICLDLICSIKNKDLVTDDEYGVYVTFKRMSKKSIYKQCEAVTFMSDPPEKFVDMQNQLTPHEINITFHPVSSGTPVLQLRPRGKGYAVSVGTEDAEPNEYLDAVFLLSDLDKLIAAKKISLKFCDEGIVFDERHFWLLKKFDQEIYKVLTEQLRSANKMLIRAKNGREEYIQDNKESVDPKNYDILIK